MIWIRHGKTAGNLQKRYIGRTDEPLCREGRKELYEKKEKGMYPGAEVVYVSPMRRCMETAEILYPSAHRLIVEEFKECDFGLFEGKNSRELSELSYYQKWLDSGGALPFPGGESREAFCGRCIGGMKRIAMDWRENGLPGASAACIVHGGTIMAVMESFCREKKTFYDYQVENAGGFVCEAWWEMREKETLGGAGGFHFRIRSRL